MILAFFLVTLPCAAPDQTGATGYIALMVIFGLPPLEMKVTALLLNHVVAAIGTHMVQRTAQLSSENHFPFPLPGYPFAAPGGVNPGAGRVIPSLALF
ncbi:hypothetical protein [Gemmobacter sp. 24YEA27]|uniref:hypothetical protein n=1 Tax=Gemmobacter sp. 24YEA27 TaxID=3040672 RepID=UPI0024B3946B|nr:hypothetical protein [Gemmobacter sp. 24YEA27]